MNKLQEALGSSQISCIIATCVLKSLLLNFIFRHWHEDHVGGISQVLQQFVQSPKKVPVYKIRRTDGIADKESNHFTFIEDGYEVSVPGATLK